MSVFHPWVLATVAACSVALVAGPVSAWTRRYVRDPLGHDDRGSGIDRPEDRERSEYSTPPRPGLLAIVPQSLLSLALCGFCAWWGMTADVMGAALVAVPVYALLTSAACVDAVAHLLPNRLLGATAAWLSACGVVAVVAHPGNAHAGRERPACCSHWRPPAWGWGMSSSARSSVSGWAGTAYYRSPSVCAPGSPSADSPPFFFSSLVAPGGRIPWPTVRTSSRAP